MGKYILNRCTFTCEGVFSQAEVDDPRNPHLITLASSKITTVWDHLFSSRPFLKIGTQAVHTLIIN